MNIDARLTKLERERPSMPGGCRCFDDEMTKAAEAVYAGKPADTVGFSSHDTACPKCGGPVADRTREYLARAEVIYG